MNQEFPFPAKLFADAAKQFQELGGQNLNNVGAYLPPIAQAMMKFNIEMMRFASKRSVECSELPEKMAKCLTTPDMFRAQMSFVETMRQQYAEEWFRLLEIMGEFSWSAMKPDGAMNVEAAPNWSGMTAWAPLAAWSKSFNQSGTQPSPAPSNSHAGA